MTDATVPFERWLAPGAAIRGGGTLPPDGAISEARCRRRASEVAHRRASPRLGSWSGPPLDRAGPPCADAGRSHPVPPRRVIAPEWIPG